MTWFSKIEYILYINTTPFSAQYTYRRSVFHLIYTRKTANVIYKFSLYYFININIILFLLIIIN
jgi:hypothetical protein